MKSKIILLVSILAFFNAGIFAASNTAGTRPNIIILLADDFGYADAGFNRAPGTRTDIGIINTPNLDALANNGIIASNAHVVHPFCGPSRTGIMTGVYPHRIGAQYNLPNDITTELGIDVNETYFAKVLQDADYNTAAYGKWHLGFVEGKYQPLDRGFDEFFGFCGGGKEYFRSGWDAVSYQYTTSSPEYNDPSKYNELKPDGVRNTNEYLDPIQRGRSYVDRKEFGMDEYLTDILTDEVIDFIDRKAGDSEPFFQYVAYNAPHTPLQAPEAEIAAFKDANPDFESNFRNGQYLLTADEVTKYTDPTEKQEKIDYYVKNRIIYATMVTILDRNIGRIVQKLKDENIFDNTVIIFFSDNGGYEFSKGAINWPLNEQKGSVDEGGHRIPYFIHWPEKITTPSVYPYQVSSLDLYPSLSALAGGTIPAGKTIDGIDIIDKMIAGENAREGEALYIMRPQNGFNNAAVISYPYRASAKGGNAIWKLYDVRVNPEVALTGNVDGRPVQAIIDELVDLGAEWARTFIDKKPEWFDHDRGDGHPHRILWFGEDLAGNTAAPVFPCVDKTFKDATLVPDPNSEVDQVIENMISVFPNPTTELFNIRFDTSVKDLVIELVSVSGQVIKSVQTSDVNETSINAGDVPSGMYMIRIKADNNLSFEKVMVL